MEGKSVNNDTVEVNSEVAIVDLWSNSEVEFKCDHCIVLYKNETKHTAIKLKDNSKTLSEKNAEISDGYKKICIDRGFKKDTPEFWNCFDMQELKRYIKQLGEVVIYYRDVTMPNGDKGKGVGIEIENPEALEEIRG